MANGINKAIVLGRVGRDPEVRYTGSGSAVANFSIATTYKSRDNEYTEWHNIVVFGKLAEIVEQYVNKGDLLYTEGRIQTRKWQDRDGNDRYSTEIIVSELQMLGSKRQDQSGRPASQQHRKPPEDDLPKNQPPVDDNFDDIPF